MPTNEQRMSPLVKRVYRTIQADGSCRILSEQCSVEQAVFAYAAAVGRNVTELLAEWSGRPETVPRKRTPPPTFGDDDQPVLPDVPDNDVAPEPESRLCPNCQGRGRDPHTGATCRVCQGTGRLPLPDDDTDDGDDDDSVTKGVSSHYGFIEDEE
jgi:hypothetical protein